MDFVALELLRALSKIDQVNEYFVYVNEGDDPCFQSQSNFRVVVHKAPYPIWEQYWLPKRAKADKLDLIHCTSNTAPIAIRTPLIVTLHDVIYLEKNPLFTPGYTPYQRFGNLYRRVVVRSAVPLANRVLTVSNYEVQNVLNYLPEIKDRLYVLYNGVGVHFKRITDPDLLEQVRRKYQLPDKYIMFLGNTDPKKNTENTLKAFQIIAKKTQYQYKLLLGDLDRQYVRNLLERNRLTDIYDHIHFTGYIRNSELPAILSQAHAFLYTSLRESFGIPIIEAMACGVPVITSNVTSMPEVAGDAALFANPHNPEEIAEATLRILTDSNLENQLVSKGLQRAKIFNWENSAHQLLRHYKELT